MTDNHENNLSDVEWIKELIRSEKQMEDAGLVDFSPLMNKDQIILSASIDFLRDLKRKFISTANVFNKLKGQSHGQIKIYGIAKTHADFMLFRNGYKLVFNMVTPGKIQVTFHNMASPFLASEKNHHAPAITESIPNATLEAAWGALNEVRWIADKKPVNPDHMVKFYLRAFVQNSAK